MVKISIIIPAYNEEDRLEKTVKDYTDYFENQDYELIIIPNGCRDKTEEITEKLSKKNT